VSEVVDRNAVIGSLVRDGTDAFGMQDYDEGYQDLEDILFGVAMATGKAMRKVIEMTIENRGAVVRLQRTQRLTWTPPVGEPMVWYGLFEREVTLRVWHDGSVTIESEVER
jgi:hypothetical protein